MGGSGVGWPQNCMKIRGFGNFESLDFFSVRSVRRLPATFFIAHVCGSGMWDEGPKADPYNGHVAGYEPRFVLRAS